MEVEVDVEERAGLDQDVWEAVDRKIREEEERAGEDEDSGTEWTNCIQLTVSFTLMFLYYGTDHYFLMKKVSPHEVDTLVDSQY